MSTKPMGFDIFGINYLPTVGVLEPVFDKSFPPKTAEYFAGALYNHFRGNAYTPYFLAEKKELSKAIQHIQANGYHPRSDRKYFNTRAGVQYMMSFDLNYFDYKTRRDTTRPNPQRPLLIQVSDTRVMTANYTLRLADVATSKLLSIENYHVSATSEEHPYHERTAPNDSVRAFRALCKKATYASDNFLKSRIHGAGRIDSVLRIEKERAKEVALNNCPQAWLPKGTDVDVWKILKKYPIGKRDTIWHAERWAQLRKPDDFTSLKINFEVVRREKDLLEAFQEKAILPVVSRDFPVLTVSAEFGRPSFTIDSFKVSGSKILPSELAMLRAKLGGYFTDRPSMADLVDRDIYNFIEKERTLQQLTKSDATEAAVSVGATFVLAVEITDFKTRMDIEKAIPKPVETAAAPAKKEDAKTPKNEPAKKDDKAVAAAKKEEKKPAVERGSIHFYDPEKMVPVANTFKVSFDANIKLVNIGTSEVLLADVLKIENFHKIGYTTNPAALELAQELAFQIAADNFAKQAGERCMPFITARLRLLEIEKSDDGAAEKIIVEGGSFSGFREYHDFEVVEITTETVDEQPLERAEVIGTIKIDDLYPETMRCKVKKGGKAIFEKMSSGAKIFARLAK